MSVEQYVNNLGTIACSKDAYRGPRGDQGLVNPTVSAYPKFDTVEVSGSNPP